MIVVMYDSEDSSRNKYFIMIEQELVIETIIFDEAVFLLLAIHYILDLEYDALVSDTLLFLQEFVCKVKGAKKKHSPVYSAISTYKILIWQYLCCNGNNTSVVLTMLRIC